MECGWTTWDMAGAEGEAMAATVEVAGRSGEVRALMDLVRRGRVEASRRDGVPGVVLSAVPRRRLVSPEDGRGPSDEELELRGLVALLRDRPEAPMGAIRTQEGRVADARTDPLPGGVRLALLDGSGELGAVVMDREAAVELACRLMDAAREQEQEHEQEQSDGEAGL